MICLDEFREELESKTEKEIITTIKGLKQKIGRMKNKLEDNINLDDHDIAIVSPSYQTQIQYMRTYIEMAKKTLEKRGISYSKSKKEEYADAFQDNIENIEEVKFSRLSFHEGNFIHTVTFKDDDAVSRIEDMFNEKEKILFSRKEFLEKFSKLYVGEWKRNYALKDMVLDGFCWELDITYGNGKKISFGGDNSVPYNFKEAEELFRVTE